MSISSRIRGWVEKARALANTHTGQQVSRFARLAAVTAVTVWIGSGHVVSRAAVWGAVVGGVEVAFRQWRQTVVPGDVSSVPEPESVESPADPAASVPEISETVPVEDPSQGL